MCLHYGKVDTKHFKKVVTVANTVLEFDLLLVIKPLHGETFSQLKPYYWRREIDDMGLACRVLHGQNSPAHLLPVNKCDVKNSKMLLLEMIRLYLTLTLNGKYWDPMKIEHNVRKKYYYQ